MSNNYPDYILPTSSVNELYPDAKHLNVLDYMTWDSDTPKPSSLYHPIYRHNIKDGFNSLKEPATAASIELGIGKHIADIAKFANMNNLGYNGKRVGVSYFNNIETSGLLVQNNTMIDNLTTNIINISGCVLNDSVTINTYNQILNVGDNVSIHGVNDVNKRWTIEDGNFYTLDNIDLLDGDFKIFTDGSGSLNSSNNIIFKGSLSARDINVPISGYYDYYNKTKVSDSVITYSTDGHNHNSTGWSNISYDEEITNYTYFENNNFYSQMENEIVIFKSNGTENTQLWETFNTANYRYTLNGINYINTTKIISINYNSNILTVNGEETQLPIDINNNTKLYNILNDVYLVYGSNKVCYIEKITSRTTQRFNFVLVGEYIISCSYGNEIFIISKIKNKLLLTKFNLITFKNINFYILDSENVDIKDFYIIEHCLFISYLLTDIWYVKVYDITSNINKILFQKEDDGLTKYLSCTYNQNYIFVQFSNERRTLNKNKSANLGFDSINGILSFNENIKVNKNLNSKSIISAYVKDSIYKQYPFIDNDEYLLNPESLETSYIDRILKTYTETSPAYNDFLCSIVFNNTYYIGTRNGVISFNKDNNQVTQNPTFTSISNKSFVKFLTLNNDLYALVQDYETSYIDLLDYSNDNIQSPYANYYTDSVYDDILSYNRYGNYVPYTPGYWSIPITKLYKKTSDSDNWEHSEFFYNKFKSNLIDAISYENSIYTLSYDNTGSGVIAHKFNKKLDEISLSYSGVLELNEALTTISDEILTEFEIQNGNITTTKITSSNVNGEHKFYLYNSPSGPYVVHEQVELLYDKIIDDSIYGINDIENYNIKNYNLLYNKLYSYKTISITNLLKIYRRQDRNIFIYDVDPQTEQVGLNNPNIKIPIIKDIDQVITDDITKYKMTKLGLSSKTRETTRFITSITYQKNMYILVQVNNILKIYKIDDLGNYATRIPLPLESKKKTIVGDGLSYIGIPTNDNYIENYNNKGVFYLDFVPFEVQNLLLTEINLNSLITDKNLYILGDGDDIVIQNSESNRFRNNKRYASASTISVGSSLYLPITCRERYPEGELYTFILGFFSDCSVGIVENNNIPVKILDRVVGRTQCLYKDGKYAIISAKLNDNEDSFISPEILKTNEIYKDIIKEELDKSVNSIYNIYGQKDITIAEYDIKITDNLNIRENL